MKKTLLILALAAGLAACGPALKDSVKIAAPTPEVLQSVQDAGLLVARGSYTALKEACRLYAGAYATTLRSRVAADYFRAAFLLGLREKELGLTNVDSSQVLIRLIQENPALAGYRAWPELSSRISPRIKGVVKDFILGIVGAVPGPEAEQLFNELPSRAASDELAAYFFLALKCPNKSPYDKFDDVDAVQAAHPGSALIAFRTAFCPAIDAERFEVILKNDPEFWEAYGFRGEAALSRGELLSAEKDLLIASEHIPESSYYNILLASVYFFTEEFEQCLVFCDKAIALSPEYRDAYLTKAICLSQLGRYPEALGVLDRIIEMQYYLQGEAHYWSAWNQHVLKDLPTAQVHIEAAKGTLPTNSEVFGLAGTIALERGEMDRAEKDFAEAAKLNANNHEAVFGLARIAEQRQKWTDAAGFFERAAGIMAANETALKAKIDEIKASGMAESRMSKMLAKKEAQLRISEATRATAFYNAAASWINGGQLERARKDAERAAEHPQLKARVAELLEKIK